MYTIKLFWTRLNVKAAHNSILPSVSSKLKEIYFCTEKLNILQFKCYKRRGKVFVLLISLAFFFFFLAQAFDLQIIRQTLICPCNCLISDLSLVLNLMLYEPELKKRTHMYLLWNGFTISNGLMKQRKI